MTDFGPVARVIDAELARQYAAYRPTFDELLTHHRALHAAGRDESRNLEPVHSTGMNARDWGINVGRLTPSERASYDAGFTEDARLARRPTRR